MEIENTMRQKMCRFELRTCIYFLFIPYILKSGTDFTLYVLSSIDLKIVLIGNEIKVNTNGTTGQIVNNIMQTL